MYHVMIYDEDGAFTDPITGKRTTTERIVHFIAERSVKGGYTNFGEDGVLTIDLPFNWQPVSLDDA